jgi:cyclopropane fatty-acyl-phospholipid synthase-like methyltransferase
VTPVDPQKFTTIAHGGHRYYSPLSPAKAAALARMLALSAGDRVLDIGCGRAQFLLEVVAAHPAVHGVGVDRNAAFIACARAAAVEAGVADRTTLLAAPVAEAVRADGRFAAVVCMGSSQAVGTFPEALAWAARALSPGGTALFADGYWKQPPAPDYLDVLGATADEMLTHADNAAAARAAGFRVLATTTSSDDEWDEYEGLYCAAVERHVDTHPDDPDAAAMAARIRRWHDAYLRWGRATLGFGFYLLLKPRSSG